MESEKRKRQDRTKRKPRDMGPDRQREWSPNDDLYGESQRPVDADLDLDGKFSTPPPRKG